MGRGPKRRRQAPSLGQAEPNAVSVDILEDFRNTARSLLQSGFSFKPKEVQSFLGTVKALALRPVPCSEVESQCVQILPVIKTALEAAAHALPVALLQGCDKRGEDAQTPSPPVEGGRRRSKKKTTSTISPEHRAELHQCLKELLSYLWGLPVYGAIITCPGMSPSVFNDDLNELVVSTLKLHTRTTLAACHGMRDHMSYNAGVLSEIVTPKELGQLHLVFTELLGAFHKCVSLYCMPESHWYQLITICAHLFTLVDPNHHMLAVATDFLVAVFNRLPDFREAVLQSLVTTAPSIPTQGKQGKRSRVAVPGGLTLSVFSVLLFRICHCAATPPNVTINDHYDKVQSLLVEAASSAAATAQALTQGILSRCLLRSESREDRNVVRTLLQDAAQASLNPLWPGGLLLVRAFCISLIRIVGQEQTASYVDATTKEACLMLLGEVGHQLFMANYLATINEFRFRDLNEPARDGTSPSDEDYRKKTCVCGKELGNTESSIACDDCCQWFHCKCVGLSFSDLPDRWTCDTCWFRKVALHLRQESNSSVEWIQRIAADESLTETMMDGDLMLLHVILAHIDSVLARSPVVYLEDFQSRKYLSTIDAKHCGHNDRKTIADRTAVLTGDHPIFARSAFLCWMGQNHIRQTAGAVRAAQGNGEGVRNDSRSESSEAPSKVAASKGKRGRKNNTVTDDSVPVDATEGSNDCAPLDLLLVFFQSEWIDGNSKFSASMENKNQWCADGPVLPLHNVHRVWRQLICKQFDKIRTLLLQGLIAHMFRCQLSSLRRAAVVALSSLIAGDPTLLRSATVVECINNLLKDRAPKVRERSLALLDRMLSKFSSSDVADWDVEAETVPEGGDGKLKKGERSPAKQIGEQDEIPPDVDAATIARDIGKGFINSICRMTNDVSAAVRTQAIRTLRRICLQQPDTEFARVALLRLLERLLCSDETSNVRDLVLDTFCLTWFDKTKPPTPQSTESFIYILTAAERMMQVAEEPFLQSVLRQRKRGTITLTEDDITTSITRWLQVLLDVFLIKKGTTNEETQRDPQLDAGCSQVNTLRALRLVGEVRPHAIAEYLCHFTPYLKSLPTDRVHCEVVSEVSGIVALSVKHIPRRAGSIKDIRLVQHDLTKLFLSRGQVMRAAITALCACVEGVTKDFTSVLEPLVIESMRTLMGIRDDLRQKGASVSTNLDVVRRKAWQIACICEFLDIEAHVMDDITTQAMEPVRQGTPMRGKSSFVTPKRAIYRSPEQSEDSSPLMKLSSLREALTPDSENFDILFLIFGVLCDLFDCVEDVDLKKFLLQCLGNFLRRQKKFVRSRRIRALFEGALTGPSVPLRIGCLQVMFQLLKKFEREAVAVGAQVDPATPPHSSHGLAEAAFNTSTSESRSERSSSRSESAVESAQPLALHLDVVLDILRDPSTQQSGESHVEYQQRQQLALSAVQVVNQLHRQGLINPGHIVAPIFSLMFSENSDVRFRAFNILRRLLDSLPDLMINKLEVCLTESFVFMLRHNKSLKLFTKMPTSLLDPISELYAERYRSRKIAREKIITCLVKLMEKSIIDSDSCLGNDVDTYKTVETLPEAGSGSMECDADPSVLVSRSKIQLLYLQFVAFVLCHLPFVFDSEVLYVIHSLANSLSLKGHVFISVDVAPQPDSQSSDAEHVSTSIYSSALSSVVSMVVRDALKQAYGITDTMCQEFNPEAPYGKERPKYTSDAMTVVPRDTIDIPDILKELATPLLEFAASDDATMLKQHVLKLLPLGGNDVSDHLTAKLSPQKSTRRRRQEPARPKRKHPKKKPRKTRQESTSEEEEVEDSDSAEDDDNCESD
eukprot:GHVN01020672.1.p1 GENE.GHVN01020672.1~~GHVN01020672.1.p1  ORF type:complete len:1817 (+),score=181.84 GHVN01020672.1:576-6026(+)